MPTISPESKAPAVQDARTTAHPTLLQRAQLLGACLLVGASFVSAFHAVVKSPAAPFVIHGDEAAWLMEAHPVGPRTELIKAGTEQTANFTKTFTIETLPEQAIIAVRALGTLKLRVNATSFQVAVAPRDCLKRTCRVDVTAALTPGQNHVAAQLVRADGPPMFRLATEPQSLGFASDETWNVSDPRNSEDRGNSPTLALRADDTRPYEPAANGPTPAQALVSNSGTALLFCLLGVVAFALRQRLPWIQNRGPWLVLAAVTIFWILIFATKTSQIPTSIGHDARSHLHYVHYITDRGTLPLADEGFSLYHPPLYYLTSAALLRAFAPERNSENERRLLKTIPMLSGLLMAWLTLLLLAKLYPTDPSTTAFGVALAGIMPLNVYMSAYLSNEPLHALLAGTSLVATIYILLAPKASNGSLALLSISIAAMILTKYTGLLLGAVMIAFVALKLLAVEGRGWIPTIKSVLGVTTAVAILGGGPYLRNWIHFGDPLIWNLTVNDAVSWWQPPSFRTVDYYLSFGESLQRPYFSTFVSYWDAMYSGLWGEGLPPSAASLETRHSFWNYEMMTAGYLLALPATACIGVGFFRLIHQAFTSSDNSRRLPVMLVCVLIYAVAFSSLMVSIRYPFWSGMRATYALSLVVPLAICGAEGLASCDRYLARHGATLTRAAFYGWFAAFVGVEVLAFAS